MRERRRARIGKLIRVVVHRSIRTVLVGRFYAFDFRRIRPLRIRNFFMYSVLRFDVWKHRHAYYRFYVNVVKEGSAEITVTME